MAAAANFAWCNRQGIAHPCARPSRASSASRRRSGNAPGLRRRAQHRQDRGATRARPLSCTARAPRARSRPVRPRSPTTTAPSASRCSSRAAWGRRATCSPASRGRWRSHSAPPATAPGALCAARLPASGSAGASCAASSRSAASSSAAPRPRVSPRRRPSPTRTSSEWSRRRAGRARPSRRPPRAARGGQGLRKPNARRSARSTAAATRYVAVQCAVRTRYARSAALPLRPYAPS